MVSTFFDTFLTLFCEITSSPQYDLVYKIHKQFKTKDVQQYFLVQSVASD
jgi:hypothetical protein